MVATWQPDECSGNQSISEQLTQSQLVSQSNVESRKSEAIAAIDRDRNRDDIGEVSLNVFRVSCCFALLVCFSPCKRGLQSVFANPNSISFCYAPKDMQTKLIWNAASGGHRLGHKIWASFAFFASHSTDVMACKQILREGWDVEDVRWELLDIGT